MDGSDSDYIERRYAFLLPFDLKESFVEGKVYFAFELQHQEC